MAGGSTWTDDGDGATEAKGGTYVKTSEAVASGGRAVVVVASDMGAGEQPRGGWRVEHGGQFRTIGRKESKSKRKGEQVNEREAEPEGGRPRP